MKLKPSSTSKSQTLTNAAASSQDARLLVRETLRISANLASAPPSEKTLPPLPQPEVSFQEQFVDSSLRLICSEEIDGRRWNYFAEDGGGGSVKFKKGSIRSVSLQSPKAPVDVSFISSTYMFLLVCVYMCCCDDRLNEFHTYLIRKL